MNRRSILSLMAVGVICFYAGNIAMADEVLKFRIVMHATSIQTQEVGDVDGHTMSVGRYSGLASFPDGSVGTANFTFTSDYIKGAGTFLTYFNVTLKDGSTLWWKGTGQAKPEGTTTIFLNFRLAFSAAWGDSRARKATATRRTYV
jgi:hypothetical protein